MNVGDVDVYIPSEVMSWIFLGGDLWVFIYPWITSTCMNKSVNIRISYIVYFMGNHIKW